MAGPDHQCRWCRKPITLYLGSWWTADEQCDCPAGEGEHVPFKVTVLPPQQAWDKPPPHDPRQWNKGKYGQSRRNSK